jgi:hypothetical protein
MTGAACWITASVLAAPENDCAPNWRISDPSCSEMTDPNEIETSAAGRMQTREMNQHWSMNSRVWNGRWKIPTTTSRPRAKSLPVDSSAPAPGKLPAVRRLLTRHSGGTCA